MNAAQRRKAGRASSPVPLRESVSPTQKLRAAVEPVGDKYAVVSGDGKQLGVFDTQAAADARWARVQFVAAQLPDLSSEGCGSVADWLTAPSLYGIPPNAIEPGAESTLLAWFRSEYARRVDEAGASNGAIPAPIWVLTEARDRLYGKPGITDPDAIVKWIYGEAPPEIAPNGAPAAATPAAEAVKASPAEPATTPLVAVTAPTARANLRASAIRVTGKPLDEGQRQWPIDILAVGPSLNKGRSGRQIYYGQEAVKGAVDRKVFERMKSYVDHPTRTEEVDQPERSWDKIAGVITNVAFDPKGGPLGKGAAVGVWNIVDDDVRQKVINAAALGVLDALGGFSINAAGDTDVNANIDGEPVELVTVIHGEGEGGAPAPSVDAVTQPAAGGGFRLERLAASVRRTHEEHSSITQRLVASVRASAPSPTAQEVPAMKWSAFLAAKPKLGEAILHAKSDDDAVGLVESLDLFKPEEADARTAFLAEVATERKKLKEAVPPPPPAKVDPLSCPTCGKVAEAGAAFCPHDGTKLAAVVTPAAVQPVAEVAKPALSAEDKAALQEGARFKRLADQLERQSRERLLEGCNLPAPTITMLRDAVIKADTDETAKALIEAQRKHLADLAEANPSFPIGTIRGVGNQPSATGGDDPWDKYLAGWDGFFAREDQKTAGGDAVPRFRNLREACARHPRHQGRYVDLLPTELLAECRGHYEGLAHRGREGSYGLREGRRVRLTESNHTWLRESASTSSFAEVWADRAYKRMMTRYHSSNDVKELLEWASDKEEMENFLPQRVIQLGEYLNPDQVAEGGTYLPATTPGNKTQLAQLYKWGFIEDITMEALLSENGKVLATLPDRMMEAVLRLERQYIINQITTSNPVMNGDSVALFDSAHANQDVVALSINELVAVETAMMNQAALSSSALLGPINRPWGIIIPHALNALSERIINPSPLFYAAVSDGGSTVTNDPGRYAGKLKILVASHFTNAKDWYVQADPSKMPTFQISRLRGVTGPEFFTQDSEDSTAQMNSDKILWKVRTFLGADALDYRSYYYNDVA